MRYFLNLKSQEPEEFYIGSNPDEDEEGHNAQLGNHCQIYFSDDDSKGTTKSKKRSFKENEDNRSHGSWDSFQWRGV